MLDRKIRDNDGRVWLCGPHGWKQRRLLTAQIIFDILLFNFVIRTKKSLLQQRITDLCNMRQTGYFPRC